MSATAIAYLVGGIALIAVLTEIEPEIGGWLLLLTVIGLMVSAKGRAIINGKG